MEDYYLWLKAAHIIFVIFWCAGLLMLPRFFAYHCQCEIGSDEDLKWQTREKSLLRIIMNPSLIIVLILGIILSQMADVYREPWFLLKFALISLLMAMHMFLARQRKNMAAGKRPYNEKFYRKINELPPLLIIIIVILVIVRPF